VKNTEDTMLDYTVVFRLKQGCWEEQISWLNRKSCLKNSSRDKK
jgi:hypothetical protein